MANTRNQTFDALKGILIILVVYGHIIPGSYSLPPDINRFNMLRYAIYIFHMPLFFALAGYLGGGGNYAGREGMMHLLRRIYPVLIALIVSVMAYQIGFRKGLDVNSLLKAFYNPFNHLWYLETFVVYTLLLSLIDNRKLSIPALFVVTVFFSLVLIYLRGQVFVLTEPVFRVLVRSFEYLPFYLLGVWTRRNTNVIIPKLKWTLLLTFLGVIFCALCLSSNNWGGAISMLYPVGVISFNSGLILSLAKLSQIRAKMPRFLSSLGQMSLFIYLWHYAFTYIVSRKMPYIVDNALLAF
ncbi:acyltransferase, partial [Akkermansiaceae bacterium]|nr:acyltransferase [Akkermansiaceae bacterium]